MLSKKLKEEEESRLISGSEKPEELYSESEEEEEEEMYEEELEEKNPYSMSLGINLAPDVDENDKPAQNESEIIIRKQQLIQQHQQHLIQRQHQQSLQIQQRQHELQRHTHDDGAWLDVTAMRAEGVADRQDDENAEQAGVMRHALS